jgi:hypothetical protein
MASRSFAAFRLAAPVIALVLVRTLISNMGVRLCYKSILGNSQNYRNHMDMALPVWTAAEWASIVSAVTALVAVVVSPWMQSRIAKRVAADNISAKRQVWIDELRNDAAEYLELTPEPGNAAPPPPPSQAKTQSIQAYF